MKTLKKLQLNDAKVLSNSEMKNILGGTGTGTGTHCLQACKCSNGTVYYVACDASCSTMAPYVCK